MEIGQKALFYHVLMFGVAVVGEGFDGDAATGIEKADDLKIFLVHQFDQVLHDDVDAVLVEVAMVTETEEIEFQALALYHQRTRDVVDDNMTEVRLPCLGAKRGEFRAIQGHHILILGMLVFEGLQHFGRIIVGVLRVLVA